MTRLAIGLLIAVASVFPTTAGELRLREGRSVIRDDWADRVERARQESARYVGAAVDAFRLHATPRADLPPSQTTNLPLAYLGDPTLRYGDVIAVEGRLIVFRGAGLPPHRATDFQELGQARTLGGVHDRELRSIDRVLARDSAPTR